ncbi:MAG: hypothetical protein WBX25_15915 [Rhodomicrobium sp.]
MSAKTADNYNVVFIAFAIGWAIFAAPWLSGYVTIPYDAKAHFLPQLQFLAHALHSGQSPFWTHNVFGGSPQIADPQSLIFSPAILLAYLEPFPSFRELDLYCFLLLGLAGISVIMFFKDRGWRPAGAVVAALAVSFGGSSIWRVQHIKQIESFAFFMMALWLLARALDRRSWLAGIAAGIAGGMMVIEPGQVAMLGCYVLAGYAVSFWLSQPRFWFSVRRSLPVLLPGAAIAVIFATGPIILSFLFVLDSNRPEIPYAEAARGALHPASLLTAIVPDLYSVRGSQLYWGPASADWRADWLAISENMGEVYIGALPILLLLAVGIFRKQIWTREIRFFTIAAGCLLIYGLGRYTPLFPLIYYHFPGADLFRRPADATYALGAMGAVAAGYFLNLFLSGDRPGRREHIAIWSALACLFAISLAVAAVHNQLSIAAGPVLLSVAVFAAGWVVLNFTHRYWEAHGLLAIALLTGFVTLDLVIGNGPNRSTAQLPSYYEELRPDTNNETIAFLKQHLAGPANSPRRDRIELVGLGFEWPNLSLIHNFDHTLGYNPLRLGKIRQAMGADENVADVWQRRFTPLFPSYRSLMADYLGLRYIAIKQPIEEIDKKLKPGDLTLVAKTADAYIYENPRAIPRVLIADNWMLADFDQMAKDGRWPSFDPRRTVLLQRAPAKTPRIQPMSVSLAQPNASLETYENTVVQIEVNTPRPGFVILNDMWHPWWFGTVDGKPAEVLRANVLFRAIQVPAGRHTVRFEFRPIKGAEKELMARLKGEPIEPLTDKPADLHIRPEASAPALHNSAPKKT